jgi:hypothetical protein
VTVLLNIGEDRMVLTKMQLGEAVLTSELGRYEIVKLALEWIDLMKQNKDYKNLTQSELINKVLNDVITNVITLEKILDLRAKCEKKK